MFNDHSLVNSLMGLSKGNPGAHLEIYGNDLYVLFSDLARKDYKMMGHLCKTVPGALLKKASSQQDYSGIAMIQDYIDSIEVVT